MKTAGGDLIYKSATPLDATPALEVGPINNHVVTHQNTKVVLSTTTEYQITFTTTSAVPANGKIIFTFPNERVYKKNTGTLVVKTGDTLGTTVPASGVTATYDGTGTYLTMVTVTGLCTTDCAVGNWKFLIGGDIKNPPFVKELTGSFSVATTNAAGSLVNRNILAASAVSGIEAVAMTGTITRSTERLSQAVVVTFSFTNVNTYESTGKYVVTIPKDQVVLETTDPQCFLQDGVNGLNCVKSDAGSYWKITVDQICPNAIGATLCTAGTTTTFKIGNFKNPSLLSANVSPLNWGVATATSLGYKIDELGGIKPTPELKGLAITVSTALLASTIVRTDT